MISIHFGEKHSKWMTSKWLSREEEFKAQIYRWIGKERDRTYFDNLESLWTWRRSVWLKAE